MKSLTFLGALLVAAPQDPKPHVKAEEGLDRLILSDRSEVRGAIAGIDPSGSLEVRVKDSGRAIRLGVEEVARIQFGPDEAVQPDSKGEQLRLYHGGAITGKLRAFDGKLATLEAAAGSLRVRRGDIKMIILASLGGPMPDLKDEKKDILIRQVEKKEEGKEKPDKILVAEYGRLLAIGETVRFHAVPVKKEGDDAPAVGPEEDREFERATVRQIYLQRDEPGAEMPPGWFSKVLLKNGDKMVGVIQSFAPDRVRLFSHLFGMAEIQKKLIHSVSFVQHARMSVGNILVCDQNGVREFDRGGREIWTYSNNTQYCWSARKLENGNVLIANTNYNQVIEVKPSGRTGGEIVWQMEQSNYPYDAVRLDNGNTLVAEYYSNRVVEYESKSKNVVWQAQINYPISLQRLENGNTLVCSNWEVVELDAKGNRHWQAKVKDLGIRPWRAQRLENGNTLITDHQKGQVVEIDSTSTRVWEKKNLSRPVHALRLEDGNTLILEQGANRLIEVDPSTKVVPLGPSLNYPQGMSTY